MEKDSNQSQKPSPEALDAGYETSGVSIKGLAIFLFCLIVTAAIIHAGAWFLLGRYLNFDRQKDRPASGLIDSQVVDQFNAQDKTDFRPAQVGLPPPPRLQPTPGVDPPRVPAADLQEMYREEDVVFGKMGWRIDPQSHAVQEIPHKAVSEVIREETDAAAPTRSADAGR